MNFRTNPLLTVLGITDLWSSHDSAVVPGAAPVSPTVGGVDFVTSVFA